MRDKIDKFLESFAARPRTKQTYRYELENYFAAVGDIVSDEAYKEYLETLSDYSQSSKRVKLAALSGFYNYVDAWTPRLQKLHKHYVGRSTSDEITVNRKAIEKIISYCDTLRDGLIDLRDRAFVLIMADSGLRISELCRLKRGNVEWQDERVYVERKGGNKKFVRLSTRSIQALKQYLQARAKLDGATGRQGNTLPLFAQHGKVGGLKGMSVDGMRKAVKERMKQAGVDSKLIRVHDFRHYFVTIVTIASGLKLAQVLADHKSIITTNRYAHYAETETDRQYDEIFNR